MKHLIKKMVDEALILKVNKADNKLIVFSDKKDAKEASGETFRNKEKLKADGFRWNNEIKAWETPIDNFEFAKKTLAEINKSGEFIESLENLEEFVQGSEDFKGKGNLMDKIKMYIDDLASATDEQVMSAEIRRYLTFFSKFRGHSFYNTLLIFIQKPDASRVAGFRQWETKFNRRVKKGAKGIMIFAPIFTGKSKGEPELSDKELDKEVNKGGPVRFRPVYVFDISDTEAIDASGEVPAEPKWYDELEPTERTIELYNYVKEAAENMGIKISMGDAKGGERGFSAGNHINMTSSVQGAGELSTLIHEFAHELMHWKKSSIFYQGDEIKNNKPIVELQAESVAYVVMKHYDLPVQHQPTYIAIWKGNKDAVLKNMKSISEVAEFIISSIDKIAAEKKVDENLYL